MRTFNRSASIALLAALAAVSLGRAAAPAAGENAQLRSILAAWDARQERVRSYSFTWLGREFGDSGPGAAPPFASPNGGSDAAASQDAAGYRLSFAADARGRMWYDLVDAERVQDGPTGVPTRTEQKETLMIWDGDSQSSLIDGKNRLCDMGMTQPGMGDFVQIEPWMVAFRPFDPACGRLDRAKLALASAIHVVGGHKCFTVLQPEKMGLQTREFWVDPAMDYIPVTIRMVVRGVLDSETDVKCSRDPRIGWMPSSWVISCFAGSRPDVVSDGWSGKLTEYTFNNEIPDSTFVMPALPPRTWVNNFRTNEHYLVRADGSKRPVGPNEFNGHNLDQLLNSDPPNSLPHPTPRRMWLIYVNIAAVLILAAIIAARWMRQRKRIA